MELAHIVEADYVTVPLDAGELDAAVADAKSAQQLAVLLEKMEAQMLEAAKKFEFEKAAQLRDRIRAIKNQDLAGTFGRPSEEAPAG
jgi:excinuclease ABC subunit B